MRIRKVVIENFKCFKCRFELVLSDGLNILVGNNEAGKSTILEAIHIALSGILNGRYLKNELSQYLFNRTVEINYINSLSNDNPLPPPYILIEIYFEGDESPELAKLEGTKGSSPGEASGIRYCIEFDEQYQSEYQELIKTNEIKTIPIEYYKVTWQSFARDSITARNIPIKSALIDSSNIRIQNGSDLYISRIIRDNLDDKERVEISQAHRQMKEAFMETPSVQSINKKISDSANVTDKEVKISVDLSTQHAWETTLITYLDDIPFHYIGKGEQSIIKTNLALSHHKSEEANIILLEEPENHLSHTRLNELISKITSRLDEKQIIVSTHSSFVANKLGLESLILLNDLKTTNLNELTPDTKEFFRKLSGYDTLRLILCKKAILVEGDSDELIVQKAYSLNNQGRLPIDDGVDVITVGTSFLRFLEIAEQITKDVVVVTDNDGNIEALKKKYENYLDENSKVNIKICFDEEIDTGDLVGFNYNTLEPKLLKANSLTIFNKIFGKSYPSVDDLLKYMKSKKADCAIKIFDTSEIITFPNYIMEAIENNGEQQ